MALACYFAGRRAAYQRSERLYGSLFEQSVDSLVIHDLEGNIADCNAEARRSLGYTREELLSMRVADLSPGLLSEEQSRGGDGLWSRAMRDEPGRVPGVHEGEHVRKDGTRFPVEVRVGGVEYRGRRMILAAARDLTESKQAARELRESERRLSEAQSIAGAGSWEWDLLTGELSWSDQQYLNFGLDAGEFGATYESYLERLHPGDRERMERVISEILRVGGSFEEEYRLVRPDGRVRHIHTRGRAYADERGEVVRLAGADVDITERKAGEEELRASEERYRSVIERTSDGVFLTGFHGGEILEANEAFEKMLGYGPGGCAGLSAYDIVIAGPSSIAANLRRIREEGALEIGERRYRRADGAVLVVEVTSANIPYGGREVACHIVRDVTERRRSEEALGRERNLLRAVMDSTRDVIFVRDREYRYRLSNAAHQRYLGVTSQEELLGKTREQFIKEDVDDPRHEEDRRVLERGESSVSRDKRVLDASGREKWFSMNKVPLRGPNGEIEGLVAVGRDATWRKLAQAEVEEQLRRSSLRADLGEALNLGGSMSEVLQLCTDAMVERVPEISYARIWTFGEGGELTLQANSGGEGAKPPALTMTNSAIVEEVSRTHRPFVENDVPSNERLFTQGWTGDAGVNAIAGLPLIVEGSLVGFATALSSRPFAPRLVGMLEEMGGLISQGIRRKRVEEELRRSESRLRVVTSGAPVILFAIDREGTLTLSEGKGLASFGLEPGELVGKSVFDLYSHEDDLLSRLRRALAGEEVAETVEHSGMAFEARYSPTRDESGDVIGAIGVATDVSARCELEKELQHRAYHDPLTDLPNRALFMDRLEQALNASRSSGETLAVLFLDLDNFKIVNDSLSHEAGDELLVAVAGRVVSRLRRMDTAARIGGDEFTVLAGRVDGESGAVMVAERIAEALRVPFRVRGHELAVTFSIGVALSKGTETAPELLSKADMAMYHAKSGGRGRYAIFDQSMDNASLERLRLESDLRRALERGEITAHYQPVVGVEDGRIRAVEALARWEHPERGLVMPDEFIPVAEEAGLIWSIGRAVLEEACLRARRWREFRGHERLSVSVNVSARQFTRSGIVDDVRRALRRSGLEPSALTLEITESVMMEDTQSNAGVLKLLKEEGVSIAVDDFGKGYSSLTYLKRLPLDLLKIDRSFTDGIEDEAGDAAIVNAVVTFARAMGLPVLAEGVETPEQLSRLREMGCDLAQGYHFAAALPPAGLDELLRGGSTLDTRRA